MLLQQNPSSLSLRLLYLCSYFPAARVSAYLFTQLEVIRSIFDFQSRIIYRSAAFPFLFSLENSGKVSVSRGIFLSRIGAKLQRHFGGAGMAKTKPGKKDLDSYSIKGTNKIVRPGDCVLMRPADTNKPPYVARVEKIEADHRNNVKVRVRWYYRPEESMGGRRQFHGAKELFLSDHYDIQSAHTIEGKCIVHSFKNYTKLENVGPEDYFCRFEYKAATGGFTPDRVAVYCKCEMPYNPDDLMVQCDGCKDWFHPSCMGMTIDEAKKLEHFLCSECSAEDEAKRPLNSFHVPPAVEPKVETKRRKR
ncbi:PREDICTED: chromatin remodeling protein EBS-like [Ipomoea nil]|uniref:chromatin remodeling protein EBS-like n=1 Tax=Ipomoea nil TaxID=35883 RepID=UPI000901A760|nr:PREDICTED: chromatin remodeling protein EBS-like [Ipomoea nil]